MKKTIARFTVLDIETDVPYPKQAVDLCEPFLMGLKSFSVAKGELIGGSYRFFDRKHFVTAARELCKLPGPIVGYNLLGFDFVVLRELINIEPLFGRTVDLLGFLARRIGSRRGLSLDNVCKQVFGQGKLIEDRRGLVTMWMAGEREKVVQYNERDCDLTAALWLRLRNARRIEIQKRTLRFANNDWAFLDGRRPAITYAKWLAENFEPHVSMERADPLHGVHVNPLDLAREYDRYVCRKSGKVMFTREIPANEIPSGEDIGPRYCPACGEYVWHSGYIFKKPPEAEWESVKRIPEEVGKPVGMAQVEKLWTMIRPYVVKIAEHHSMFIDPRLIRGPSVEPHFIVEGVPRQERHEVRCYDDLGIDEEDFTLWLRQVESEVGLAKYIPRFREKVSYITRRGAKALVTQALREGLW